MPKAQTASEFARVKVELLRSGITVNAALGSVPFIDIIFPKGVWTSLAGEDFNCPSAEYELIQEQEFSYIVRGDERIHVEVRRSPDFYNGRTSAGKLFEQMALIRANYVEILPAALHKDAPFSENDILEVVRSSLEKGWAEYVSIYEDSNFGGENIEKVLKLIKVIKKHVDTHVSLTIEPPEDLGLINAAYGSGVDAIAYNLLYVDEEDQNKERFRICQNALKYAVNIFSAGSVASLIYLDDRNEDRVSNIIQKLTSAGVFPVLAYRTSFGKRSTRLLPVQKAVRLFREAAVSLKRSKFKLGWVPHSS
ncbi:MAG: hypothetical protein HY587_07240, partial [Candidatus Omnitrophica bacterium]|nr:hypothetical protein [Candidatus Omnitrophota bacterium]